MYNVQPLQLSLSKCKIFSYSEALLSLTTTNGSSDSVKNQTTTRENPSSDAGSEVVEPENKKTQGKVVKEGDKSDEEGAKAETLETWSSSSFVSSSSPDNLLKFVSGQSSTGY